jgi:predicted lipid-binding transport protein (Tim44 family)
MHERLRTWRQRPTLLQRIAAGLIALTMLGILAILLFFGLLVGLAVAAVAAIAFAIAWTIRRFQSRRSPQAGRRNVRVITTHQVG